MDRRKKEVRTYLIGTIQKEREMEDAHSILAVQTACHAVWGD